MKVPTVRLIVLPLVLILVIILGIVFRDNALNVYHSWLQKFDAQNVSDTIKKYVIAPGPLRARGQAHEIILTSSRVIAETNAARYDHSLTTPLIENALLNTIAKAKAEDMFRYQYFEHVSPRGVGPGDLSKQFGYEYVVQGENLILGNFKDEKEMVKLWMESPGHRANILHNRFTEIGVAVVKGMYKGEAVWIGVQEFGLPLSTCVQPDANVEEKIKKNQKTLDDLSLQIDQKKSEIDSMNPQASTYRMVIDEYNSLVNEYNVISEEIKHLIVGYNQDAESFNACIQGE